MRFLLFLTAACVMQAAHLQTVVANFGDYQASHDVSITPTTGSALVITCATYSGGSTLMSNTAITDNQSGSWSLAARDVNTTVGYTVGMFYIGNVSNSARTITCTPGVFGTITLIVSEYSNIVTSSLLDGTAGCSQGTGTTGTSSSVTTSQNNTTLVSGIVTGSGSNPTTYTSGASWTSRGSVTDGTQYLTGAQGDRQVTSTGTYSNAWGISTSIDYISCALALKETGGGGGIPTLRRKVISFQ